MSSWFSVVRRALAELTFHEERFEDLISPEHEQQILGQFDARMKAIPPPEPMNLLQSLILEQFPTLKGHDRNLEKMRFHFARKRGLLGQ